MSSAFSQKLHWETSGKYIYHVIINHTVMQVTGDSDFCPCSWNIQLPQNLRIFHAFTAISKLSSPRPLCKAHGEAIYML